MPPKVKEFFYNIKGIISNICWRGSVLFVLEINGPTTGELQTFVEVKIVDFKCNKEVYNLHKETGR